MILKMLAIVALALFLLWVFRRVAGDDVTFGQFFNRCTFNLFPMLGRLLTSGLLLIYLGGILVGFFSGFYTLYKGTDLLVRQISWNYSSVKVIGTVLDADNDKNMSEAIVQFTDLDGAEYMFRYKANYNGTVFTVDETLPVYYLPGTNPENSATLNNKGAYAGVAFLYFYGIAVSTFGIFVGRNLYRGYRRDQGVAKLKTEGMIISVPVSRIVPDGDYFAVEAVYQPTFSKVEYRYLSGSISIDHSDLDRVKGMTAKVTILPKDPLTYLFHTDDFARLVRK